MRDYISLEFRTQIKKIYAPVANNMLRSDDPQPYEDRPDAIYITCDNYSIKEEIKYLLEKANIDYRVIYGEGRILIEAKYAKQVIDAVINVSRDYKEDVFIEKKSFEKLLKDLSEKAYLTSDVVKDFSNVETQYHITHAKDVALSNKDANLAVEIAERYYEDKYYYKEEILEWLSLARKFNPDVKISKQLINFELKNKSTQDESHNIHENQVHESSIQLLNGNEMDGVDFLPQLQSSQTNESALNYSQIAIGALALGLCCFGIFKCFKSLQRKKFEDEPESPHLQTKKNQ